jgi:hypothetical protein
MRWHSTLKNRVCQPVEGEKRKSQAPPPWSEEEVERLIVTVEACRLPPAAGETVEPITEAAIGGKLVGHLVDWNTVANAMTDASLPGFNTEKHTPLQCLHRWREAINDMITESGVNLMDAGAFNNTPWTEEEVSVLLSRLFTASHLTCRFDRIPNLSRLWLFTTDMVAEEAWTGARYANTSVVIASTISAATDGTMC